MRIYLYALAGVTSALIGWNLSHFLLTDLQIMREFPQLIIFPLVTISLAVGMVINEIFISSPTRAKTNLKLATAASFKTIGIGALLGLAAAGLSFIFFLPRFDFPLWFVRTFGWLLIGVSVGLAEGLTWRDYSVESGNKKRKNQRLIVSLLGATFASVFAAVLFEISRSKFQAQFTAWQNWEDPLGFALLGLILGLSFSLTNSPSYQAALRAGTGFEYRGEHFYANGGNLSPPGIDLNILSFVSDPDNTTIEEGLSIALPGFGVISIGSDINADICIPNLAPHVADITIDRRKALLLPDRDHYKSIAINNRFLNTPVQRTLKHNTLITFHPLEPDEEQPKFYRFVYYNRFLDPQA
ncbi:MAG: hypothetical protein Cpurp_11080 [Chlorogloea purpurea SAG 13.99]|nr:hypothetical protein [Chlorogloea purpurea SAG 13.99]